MNRSPVKIWKRLSWHFVAISLIGFALGAIFGQATLGLALGLAVVVIWQLNQTRNLEDWLHSSRGLHLPPTAGPLRPFYDSIYGRHLRERARRKELHRTIREFRDASHALPDAMVVVDDDGGAPWFNQSAHTLLGLKAPQDFGRPVTNLIRNPQFRRWLAASSEEAEQTEDHLTIVSPIDPLSKILFTIVPLSEGRYLLIGRDVTVIHRLDEMRKDFVANVSHELRTPLTVVSGYLEAMGDTLSAEWQGPVDQMSAQCKRMKELIDDLLVIARLDSGERSREIRTVDVPGLVSCIAEEAEVESRGGHTILCDITSRANLKGVYKDLRVAFGNLVTNAIRYTPAGGTITIQWLENADSATFSVTDTGPGIPAKFIPRLTERFYRIDSERSRATGGTGLGLAIVKHVVTQHKGELIIESTVGTGSRFSCRFPPEAVCYPASNSQRRA